MKCIKCGDCCEAIALGATIEQIKADARFLSRDFILEHWTPCEPPKQKLNPLMNDKCFNGFIWYECDLFDSETRVCKDHKNKPAICKEYPGGRKSESLISARCGFFKG